MTYRESIVAAAEEVVVALRQYVELATSSPISVADVDQSWVLVRQAMASFIDTSPTPVSIELPASAPLSPRHHPVVWLDVGYAVEIRNLPLAAGVLRSRLRGRDQGSVVDGDEFDMDPVALVDALEAVDGWSPDQYGEDVLSLVTTTRALQVLTKHKAEVLRNRIDSGSQSSHRPEDL